MRTQWRTGVNGYSGLDYGVLRARMKDDLGLAGEVYEQTFFEIRVMESAALEAIDDMRQDAEREAEAKRRGAF